MLFETNKEKGRAGLCFAIAYFGSNGWNVSLPLNDTQDYDLIIEKNNIFQKVQCKATGCKNKNNTFYIVQLRSTGSHKIYGTVKDSSADLLFVLTKEKQMYLIPINEITQSTSLTLNPDYDQYKINF